MGETIVVIPARWKSKRFPGKPIVPLLGVPMIVRVWRQVMGASLVDRCVLATDDDRISQVARDNDMEVIMTSDKCRTGTDRVAEVAEKVDADIYVLAHTTSPFIKPSSIENALSQIVNGKNDSAFSAERIKTFAWYLGKPINYDINDVPRTQDLEPIWKETSAFFMFRKDVFIKHRRRIGFTPYIQEVTGLEAIDIDEKRDYELACKLTEIENI